MFARTWRFNRGKRPFRHNDWSSGPAAPLFYYIRQLRSPSHLSVKNHAAPEISGCGTCNVPIWNYDGTKMAFNLWLIDSGMYNSDPDVGGYDYVHEDTIEWYKATAAALAEQNGGEVVPAMDFQHIVIPEIFDELYVELPSNLGKLSENRNGKSYSLLPVFSRLNGYWLETPCPPNYGFAEGFNEVNTMLEQGDVKAIFFGHDHINSYVVPYQGMDLVSSPGFTFQSYNDAHRGVRVITIDKNDLSTYATETYTANEVLEDDSYGSFLLGIRNFFDNIKMFFVNLWYSIKGVFSK